MKPFIKELNDLSANCFQCTPPGFNDSITIKVHTLVSPVDSVERCALQNIHQYNGKYGCSFCLHPGEVVPVGKGYSRVYPVGEYANRTHKNHVKIASKAEERNMVIKGVEGVSWVLLIPNFNIIKGFSPEYMHCVLLGVVRLFLMTWFDPQFNNKLYYLGRKKQTFDNRMKQILPPCEITRTPQSVDNLCKWKASEFKNFLTYYSLPVLKN